jgi:multisubunit Na+/H+ antiporter MnhF subunit
MRTWSVLYGVVWASFFQIFLIVLLVSVLPTNGGLLYMATIGLHLVIGLVVIALASVAFRLLRKTNCPDRLKRISRVTAILAGFQGVLGIVLYGLMRLNVAAIWQDVVLLLHVAIALAIIAQASSTATAFDMWEEKEFIVAPSPTAAV